MKFINLTISEEIKDIPVRVSECYNIDAFIKGIVSLKITPNEKNKNIIKMLKDKKLFQACKDEEMYYAELTKYEDIEFEKMLWDKVISNQDNIIECINKVYLDPSCDIDEFMSKYPELKDKQIVINEYVSFEDKNKLNAFISKYKKYDNANLLLSGNTDCISIKDCEKTLELIKQVGELIKSYNLSPLEQIMFAYDITRDRVYKEESEDESYNKSRDLTNVLFGDSIVCVGYSKIFSAILEYLNIENYSIRLNKKDDEYTGHERNMVRINDDKYNIHRWLYFDTTWDSKRDEEDFKYLYKYRYFAKTRKEMEELEGNAFSYSYISSYDENQLYDVKKDVEEKGIPEYKKISNIKSIIKCSNVEAEEIDIFKLLTNTFDYDKYNEKYQEALRIFNEPLPAEIFIKALDNVRKIEHDIDPNKYPYDINKLYCIALNSKWQFKEEYYNPADRMIANIFGTPLKPLQDFKEIFIEYAKSNNITGINEIIASRKLTPKKND